MKKSLMWVIGIILVLITIILISSNKEPEFFDIFGLITFGFLFWVGSWMIQKNKKPAWLSFTILILGILGLIVDGSIIIKTYLFP